MFDDRVLWKERFSQFSKETGRYLRYIFNGHILIVFVFLLGTAAFYYQEWVKTVPNDFPAPLIMAAVLATFLTYSPVYTFFKEADRIFLLPLENRLSRYFDRSIAVSLVFQAYLLLLVLAVFMPLYARVTEAGFSSFFLFVAALWLAKWANLLLRWRIQFYTEASVHKMDSLVRYVINTVFLYLLFSGARFFLTAIVLSLLFILYFYFRAQTRQKGLKWELLIGLDEKRMASFYRVANLFTDVPQLKDRIKRRKWLDWIFARIPYGQSRTFFHLYLRTLLRAGDYFGLFLRLTFIGGVVIALLSIGVGQILFVLLFLYLTGFQLLPLRTHNENKLWSDLYPIPAKNKLQSFNRILSGILLIQTVVFSSILSFRGDWQSGLISVLLGTAFSLFFVMFYHRKRLQA